MKLGIVIVNYNSSADLDRCLESLASYPPSCAYGVVIVDNASSDEGLPAVQRRFPDHDWVFNGDNTGYARACNQGMARLAADYYLILNPDIVVQPRSLDRLLDFADGQPRAGLIGPQLLNEDGTIQESCRRFYTLRTLLLRRTFLGRIFRDSATVRRHLMKDFDHRSSRPVDWVLGGCLLVRASVLARTGPMDERFFLYFEDVDWCYRVWQAGFEVVYAPDAAFVHRHRRDSARGPSSRSFWLHLGSLLSFYEKWGILVWLLKKWRGPLTVGLLWLLDMAAIGAAFGLAYGGRAALGFLFPEALYPFAEYRPLLFFTWLLATFTFLLTGRYRAPGRRRPPGWLEHLQQVGVVGLLLMASTYLGHLEVVSRAVLLTFLPLMAGLTAVAGALLQRLLRRLERGHFSLERTLLVGAPAQLQDWFAGAGDLTAQGVDVAGYVADPETEGASLPSLSGGAVPWLGTRHEILPVVERYRISQIVFWDRPAPGDAFWQLVAGLRRLRIRLRWQIDEVWLLAAAARAEPFGGRLSAVQSLGGKTALKVVAGRVASIVGGLALAVLGLGPWLWLKLRNPTGRSGVADVSYEDAWGHRGRLKLAIDAQRRVRSLPWQWALAWPLLAGRLALIGSRPRTAGSPVVPRSPHEILDFWRDHPTAPGLGGDWRLDPPAAGIADRGGKMAAPWRILAGLWRDPCGFGTIGTEVDPAVASTDSSTSENEVAKT